MLRSIKSAQSKRRDIHLKVTGTGTAAINSFMDYLQATLVDDGTGLYTITLLKPFAEAPIVQITSATTGLVTEIVAVTASTVQVRLKDSATQAATDGVFHISIHGTDTASRF
jgi:hypothetical protein